MAMQTLGLLVLAQNYAPEILSQINRKSALLQVIKAKDGEGKNVSWAVKSDGQLAEAYGEGTDVTVYGSDGQSSAILNWGLYRAPFQVTQLALDAAATSRSPEGNLDRWLDNMKSASAALASLINRDSYTGTGTSGGNPNIVGLDAAIGSLSNTYATVDRSIGGNAFWRPGVVSDPGILTAITFQQIRSDMRKIFEACGTNPDVAMCSPAVFEAIGALFDATKRSVREINTNAGAVTLQMGFEALECDGMFFVKDKDATANTIFYLNTENVEYDVLPSTLISAIPQQILEANDGFNAIPLRFIYEMLAKTGQSEKAAVRCTPQLKVKRPNSCGVRRNVLVAA